MCESAGIAKGNKEYTKMSDLDRKLTNDISEAVWDYCHAEDTEYGIPKVVGQDRATEIIVARVKQAFIGDGWRPKARVDAKIQRGANDSFFFSGDMNALREANNLMSGQEWYDRFEIELITLSKNIYKVDESDPHFWNYYVNNGDAVEAAKKAAGIEE